jgi:hypothetical protein
MTTAVCRCQPWLFQDVAEKSTTRLGSSSLLAGVRLVGPLAGGDGGSLWRFSVTPRCG